MPKKSKTKTTQSRKGKEPAEEPEAVPTVPDEGGNTITPRPKKYVENPARIWYFTVFNYTEELIKGMVDACASVPEVKIEYIFGKEICPDTGNPHLQCAIRCSKKIRWRTVFGKVLPDCTHRKSANGTWQSNITYCSKDGDYIANFMILTPYKKKPIVLREWQEKAIEVVKMRLREDRKISWFFSYEGGVGKSVLVDYLCCNFNAVAISGTKRHILATAHKTPNTPIWIFDIPRVNKGGVSYEAMEALRNGLWFSGYGDAVGMTRLDFNPVVLVFCNELPDVVKLSEDRWDIWEIKHNDIYKIDYEDV